MARPRTSDLILREAISLELRRFFQFHNIKKGSFAQRLGVSRQALYTYLTGHSTPSSEVLAKLLQIDGFSISIGGKRLVPSEVISPERPHTSNALGSQYELPFNVPVVLTDADRFSIHVERKEPGRIQVTVHLLTA